MNYCLNYSFEILTICIYHFSDEIIKRNDLTLPWRPIYDLYIDVTYQRNSKNLEKSNIRSAVLAVKELFPLSATKEILDEVCF